MHRQFSQQSNVSELHCMSLISSLGMQCMMNTDIIYDCEVPQQYTVLVIYTISQMLPPRIQIIVSIITLS